MTKPKKPTQADLLGRTVLAWGVSDANGLRPYLCHTRADAMDIRRRDETVVRVLVAIVASTVKEPSGYEHFMQGGKR
jgi:hypothetical protein